METETSEQYKTFLVNRGIGNGSIRNYIFCLRRFKYPFTATGIADFILENRDKYRHSYINKYIFALRLYGECFGIDDLKTLKPLKKQSFAKATMSVEEIMQFLSLHPVKNEDKKLHAYWTLFFKVCASCGMRTGEVANLKIDDVDFGRQVFVLQKTKTGYPRNVPIPKSLIPELQEQIKKVSKYVFESPRTGRLPNSSLWNYQFHTRLKKLGIKRKNLTPYSLRHSFITRMLEEDVNIFKVQKIVGHSNISTTAGYTHLATKDIVKAIEKDPLESQNETAEELLQKIFTFASSLIEKRFDVAVKYNGHTLEVSVVRSKTLT